ncbi:MAG: rhodanese-related sulfurtransferase [Microbacteriaceae bacterium]
MAVPKIILYYAFTPLDDPEAIKLWQRDLAELLGLRGRVLVSKHGINGTLGGELDQLKSYIKKTKAYPGFKKLDIKWSEGTGLDEDGFSLDFPRLSVKAKDEIVSFGAPGELEVSRRGVVGGGKKLKPEEVNALVADRGDEVVFFDGRNKFEADIGKFKNAVVPDVDTTRDFVRELESGKYDALKDKPVVTYCTGGIRCEVLSSMMISRGFKEVYQMDGGIVRYGETFGDEGLWEGSLYVFDNRISMDFSENTSPIGVCVQCQSKTSRMQNCVNRASCRQQIVVCEDCVEHTIYCQNCSNSTTLETTALAPSNR